MLGLLFLRDEHSAAAEAQLGAAGVADKILFALPFSQVCTAFPSGYIGNVVSNAVQKRQSAFFKGNY